MQPTKRIFGYERAIDRDPTEHRLPIRTDGQVYYYLLRDLRFAFFLRVSSVSSKAWYAWTRTVSGSVQRIGTRGVGRTRCVNPYDLSPPCVSDIPQQSRIGEAK